VEKQRVELQREMDDLSVRLDEAGGAGVPGAESALSWDEVCCLQ